MWPYLGPPWTDSHPIWAVDVFHHASPVHGIQNAEMQKKFFCDIITSVLYVVLWYQGIFKGNCVSFWPGHGLSFCQSRMEAPPDWLKHEQHKSPLPHIHVAIHKHVGNNKFTQKKASHAARNCLSSQRNETSLGTITSLHM